ncbi:MAG: RdgB/HAM1 family non-canonical purine NTP pyrophosphatase [Acidobacteriota bacterium]
MSRVKVVLATSNPGKLREIKNYFKGLPLEFLSLEDIGVKGEVEEKGKTFFENARHKSLIYSAKSEYLTLAEDSGLRVQHLGGAPGIYSARFSDPGATDEKNIRKVLRLMKGVPWEGRGARFVCRLVLSKRGRILKEMKGEVRGRIAFLKKGDRGFGYDPVFYYAPFRRTFGELDPEKKNSVSHRGRALRQMRAFVASYLAVRPDF